MIELRPQPLGIYPFPAANLLLPEVDACWQPALESIMQGDLSIELPPAWEFFREAALGKVDVALRLVQHGPGCNEIDACNAFALSPTKDSYQAASKLIQSADLRQLLIAAAWSAGIVNRAEEKFPVDGELLAHCLAVSAAADVEQGDVHNALTKLRQAASAAKSSSPVLAAMLLSQAADLYSTTPDCPPALAIQDYQEAIRLAGDCRLPMLLPELYMKTGMLLQNAANGQRGTLLQAVNCYQSALQHGINEEQHPDLFAQVQNNLGLAYLTMPSTESSFQLRTGIAVQSFRHALRVYTIEEHPEMWASVSMNLANALQYAPSSHPAENLIQAVETYEQVLQVRTRARDPVQYALVLLNQSNALAHLGIFKPALEKLAEAYKLFHWYDMIEQANAARELVEQINETMGKSNEHPDALTGDRSEEHVPSSFGGEL